MRGRNIEVDDDDNEICSFPCLICFKDFQPNLICQSLFADTLSQRFQILSKYMKWGTLSIDNDDNNGFNFCRDVFPICKACKPFLVQVEQLDSELEKLVQKLNRIVVSVSTKIVESSASRKTVGPAGDEVGIDEMPRRRPQVQEYMDRIQPFRRRIEERYSVKVKLIPNRMIQEFLARHPPIPIQRENRVPEECNFTAPDSNSTDTQPAIRPEDDVPEFVYAESDSTAPEFHLTALESNSANPESNSTNPEFNSMAPESNSAAPEIQPIPSTSRSTAKRTGGRWSGNSSSEKSKSLGSSSSRESSTPRTKNNNAEHRGRGRPRKTTRKNELQQKLRNQETPVAEISNVPSWQYPKHCRRSKYVELSRDKTEVIANNHICDEPVPSTSRASRLRSSGSHTTDSITVSVQSESPRNSVDNNSSADDADNKVPLAAPYTTKCIQKLMEERLSRTSSVAATVLEALRAVPKPCPVVDVSDDSSSDDEQLGNTDEIPDLLELLSDVEEPDEIAISSPQPHEIPDNADESDIDLVDLTLDEPETQRVATSPAIQENNKNIYSESIVKNPEISPAAADKASIECELFEMQDEDENVEVDLEEAIVEEPIAQVPICEESGEIVNAPNTNNYNEVVVILEPTATLETDEQNLEENSQDYDIHENITNEVTCNINGFHNDYGNLILEAELVPQSSPTAVADHKRRSMKRKSKSSHPSTGKSYTKFFLGKYPYEFIDKRYQCGTCSLSYHGKKFLQHHIRNVHTNVHITGFKFHGCEHCSEKFLQRRQLLRHNREFHSEMFAAEKPVQVQKSPYRAPSTDVDERLIVQEQDEPMINPSVNLSSVLVQVQPPDYDYSDNPLYIDLPPESSPIDYNNIHNESSCDGENSLDHHHSFNFPCPESENPQLPTGHVLCSLFPVDLEFQESFDHEDFENNDNLAEVMDRYFI